MGKMEDYCWRGCVPFPDGPGGANSGSVSRAYGAWGHFRTLSLDPSAVRTTRSPLRNGSGIKTHLVMNPGQGRFLSIQRFFIGNPPNNPPPGEDDFDDWVTPSEWPEMARVREWTLEHTAGRIEVRQIQPCGGES